MGFIKSTFAIASCMVVWASMFPALGQTVSQISAPNVVQPATLTGQEFHCHTGYPLAQCRKDILQLKNMLMHYPVERLGHWTWVLVRSQDWKAISRTLQLNPMSPAFSALEPRETFLEEALFAHDPQRTAELMGEWQRSMPNLLEIAVSHELGHAFCAETNEAAADHFGDELRTGLSPACRPPKQERNKSVVAGEKPHRNPNAFGLR